MTTLGIEEEYLLLDPVSGLPVFNATEVQELLETGDTVTGDDIQRELLSCQIETATPVCETLTEAEESLLNFRRQLSAAARKAGVRASGTATAPRIEEGYPQLTDKQRYHELKSSARGIVADQFVNGLHVHVSIPDKETGVQALNRIRTWLPIITALSANSPYWLDRDSGFASWRTVHYRRWPIQGCPPIFADAEDYERRIQRLVDTGVIIDRGVLTWVARLSDHYPTLEVRTADAQLEAQDSVLLAGLIRGLVSTAVKEALDGAPYPDPDAELLDAAQWQAARQGLGDVVVNPLTGKLVPAREQMDRLLEHVGPALDEAGDTRWIQSGLKTVWERGTGAERQRRAMQQSGVTGLIDLYTETLIAER
ncbi:carboxylate-amine ligase [Arthrobacter pigmenti]|uniref:Putative glutamate--cysteine ligase 2 n=1 Tax=Arthrobacter pigmenti TaxID=271432 RepID=A0A846RI88_9MICC|nr:glutamate--cysteine ligase [Arthrobacter pigmenti]NJC22883.1 carboxylate-amine ligase [Arthrobacter pigmenti]